MNRTCTFFLEFTTKLHHSSSQNVTQDFEASLAVPILAVDEAGGGRGEPVSTVATVNDSHKWTLTIAIQNPRSATSSEIVSRRWI